MFPSQETGICGISQELVADDKDKKENQNEQDSESHNIAIHVANEPNQDIRDSLLPSQEAGICDISQYHVADDKDKRDNQNVWDSESHNIAIFVTNETNQDVRDKEVVQPPPEQKRLSSQSDTLALIERVKKSEQNRS